MLKTYRLFLFISMLSLACSALLAAHVDPVFMPGNPSCSDLGYDFGFKPQPEPPPSGTYTFPAPDGVNTFSLTSDGTYFDWSSTLSLDAVIVKGGPNANVYYYDPEASSDTGLHAPINPNNSQPYAISHIEVCYDYEVDVAKTADAEFTRTFDWYLDKSADVESLTLAEGEDYDVNYLVEVGLNGFTDSDWSATGSISISNNTPFDAVITGVSDVISPAIAVPVDCGVSFPYLLAAGDELTCSYATALSDASTRVNTATVETSGLVGGGEASADVVFGDPTTEMDDCVDVSDSLGSSGTGDELGTVCYASAPATFNYSYKVPTDACGSFDIDNTASLLTNDTDTSIEDSWTVSVEVTGCGGGPPSELGCTLTPGYWKTHSAYGPAPFDDNWTLLVPSAANSPFFLSGQTYYEVLWTAPRGNAYYILAHAFIAAELNVLNGASMEAPVTDAFNEAMALFETYTPEEVAGFKGKTGNEERNMFLLLAVILDGYNNGELGPGHCDELPSS